MSNFDTWLITSAAGRIIAMILEAVEEDVSQHEAALWCVQVTDGREARNRAFAVLKLPKRIRTQAEQN